MLLALLSTITAFQAAVAETEVKLNQAKGEIKRLMALLAAAENRLSAQDEAHKIELVTCACEAQDAENDLKKSWRDEKNYLLEQVHGLLCVDCVKNVLVSDSPERYLCTSYEDDQVTRKLEGAGARAHGDEA